LFAQAVEDALSGTGVEITEIPLSPSRLYMLMEDAKRTGPRKPAPGGRGRALYIEGTYKFDRPPSDVYGMLLDPEILASVMPGTKRLVRTGDRYEGLMEVGVGPISAAEFSLEVVLVDQVEGQRYTMRIDSRGKLGFVTGTASVILSAAKDPGLGERTHMDYRAELQVGGTIAAVGQRMLDSVSKAMSAQGLRMLDKAIRRRAGATV
jgi:carbon monoxide dehydrogenase subunit G